MAIALGSERTSAGTCSTRAVTSEVVTPTLRRRLAIAGVAGLTVALFLLPAAVGLVGLLAG